LFDFLQENPFYPAAANVPKATETSKPSMLVGSSRASDIRAHLQGLADMPAYIEKLERRQRADEQSLQKKQAKIQELEAEVDR
jgi:hypothetical protein